MRIELREFEISDVNPIDKIFQKQPEVGVPGFKHMISNATIVDEHDNIIGYGIVRFLAEGTLILDRGRLKRERAQAVRISVDKAITDARKFGIEKLYFLTKIPSFADVLRKHWGFKNCEEEVLVLNLEE